MAPSYSVNTSLWQAASDLVLSFTRSGSGTNKAERRKGTNAARRSVAGCERKRGASQTRLRFGLARHRRYAKRPSEPRPSGVHREAGVVVRSEKLREHKGNLAISMCRGLIRSNWRRRVGLPVTTVAKSVLDVVKATGR